MALLIILGLVALWLGRFMAQKHELPSLTERESATHDFTLSDRAVAIWALACLVAIVPVGIISLQLLIR